MSPEIFLPFDFSTDTIKKLAGLVEMGTQRIAFCVCAFPISISARLTSIVYSYADCRAIINMIRSDKDRARPSEDEMRRQEEGVFSVVQFARNISECRRVQLLLYFDENFDPKDCHQSCDNCIDPRERVQQDVTAEAQAALNIIMSRQGDVTQHYCAEVLRGANTKEVRDKGDDESPWHGAGRHLSRELSEQLFSELLAVDATRTVSVEKGGWHHYYLTVNSSPNLARECWHSFLLSARPRSPSVP